MNNHFPETLYKYKSSNEHTLKILTEKKIYLPSIGDLNDPFDGSIPFVYASEDLTTTNIYIAVREQTKENFPDWDEDKIHKYVSGELAKGFLFSEQHIEELNTKMREDVEKKFGILSLTTNKNNFLMWSHYTDSHRGLCLGFDTNKICEQIGGTLGHVTYREDIPIQKLKEDDLGDFIRRLLFTKSRVWEYEDEYRIIKIDASKSTIEISQDTICEVILGSNMESEKQDRILNITKENFPSCKIFKAILSKTKFELNIERMH